MDSLLLLKKAAYKRIHLICRCVIALAQLVAWCRNNAMEYFGQACQEFVHRGVMQTPRTPQFALMDDGAGCDCATW